MYRSAMMSFKLLFIPTSFSRLLASKLPIPPAWGNMAFEVNTICFVAFLWWLNNGLKYVAKWESEARDGSNLAFLSKRWHRPIEINESRGLNTFTATKETASARLCCLHIHSHKQLYQPYFTALYTTSDWKESTDHSVARILDTRGSQPYHHSPHQKMLIGHSEDEHSFSGNPDFFCFVPNFSLILWNI